MKVLMHALAASCEELRARTGNPPLGTYFINIDVQYTAISIKVVPKQSGKVNTSTKGLLGNSLFF
jgi:hypothetical protein